MKKLIITIIIVCMAATGCLAQEVVCRGLYNGSIGKTEWGLYNNRTQQWVVANKYKAARYIGCYDGVHYYMLQDFTTNFWGIISSKNYNQWFYSPQFTDIISNNNNFSNTGIFLASKKTDWGAFDINKDVYVSFKYKYANYAIPDGFVVRDWENKQIHYDLASIRSIRQKKQEARQKQEEEEKKKETQRLIEIAERKEKEKKEQELSSFTTYAQAYVQPKIALWQQKGEFEKTDSYRKRVTGSNRQLKIDSLTMAAEQSFISEHAALNPLQDLTINGNYDADNEVFQLRSSKFGTLLINVPIGDAPSFKSNFNGIEKRDATYFIENDKIALRSVVLYDPQTKKSFTYNNRSALNYTTYSIDADALGLAAVSITSSTKQQGGQVLQKPIVHVLSPTSGSQYTQAEVVFNIDITSTGGATPILYVSINGEDPKVIRPMQEMQKKGARPQSGKEYSVTLPQQTDKPCNLIFYASLNDDVYSEIKSVKLLYAGNKPKPVMHLYAVGVSDYASQDLQNLKYAAKDAQQFAQAAKNSAGDLYREVKPQVITNKSATKQNVEQSLAQLARDVQQDDIVMLFFSGHGVREGEDTYFMTTDGIAADPAPTSVDFGYIKKRLNAMVSKGCKVVLFMDACHSGAMLTKSGTKDLSMTLPGMIGFYSSTRLEESAESDQLGNGAFTKALLDGISGKAANSKGEITTTGLRNYIEAEVKKINSKQTPLTQNELGEVVLFKAK